MTDVGVVLARVVLNRWRAGENSADIAKAVSLTEQDVLHVIWAERAARRRQAAESALRKPDPADYAHIAF